VKKFISILSAALLVLGLAATSFAVTAEIPASTQAAVAKGSTQITLGGEVRVRGWYFDGFATNGRGSAPGNGSMAANGLYDTRVRLSLQADVTKNTTGFVELETASESSGTLSQTSDTFTWGTNNQKYAGTFNIRQAYILHKGSGLLGIPAGIKAGHQLLKLSEGQFFDYTKFGTDAIVAFIDPTKELHMGVLTAKVVEGSQNADMDAYVGVVTYKLDKANTIGANYFFLNDKTNWTHKGSLQNLGLHANGNVSGLSYKVEGDIQFGKVTGSATQKYDGYGLFLALGYKIDPVNLRASFGYGSGDNNATDNKQSRFQVLSGNDQHYSFIYEYSLVNAGGSRAQGIANTTYYNLGLDADLAKGLKGSVDAYILRASKVASGSKEIGTEFDAKLSYAVDKNLTYFMQVGYLSTGDFYAAPDNKNITQAVHGLLLSF
jgi:hypothetical protein